jgi:hypothetical protein
MFRTARPEASSSSRAERARLFEANGATASEAIIEWLDPSKSGNRLPTNTLSAEILALALPIKE